MNRRSFIAVLVAIPAAFASARSDYWSPDWVERLGFHSDFHVDPEPYMTPLFDGYKDRLLTIRCKQSWKVAGPQGIWIWTDKRPE